MRLQWKFNLGTFNSIHSGLPYDITTGEDDNHNTDPNDRPPGVTRNTGRGGGVSVDLHLGRTLGFERRGHSFQCEIAADSFNALDHFNPSSNVRVISSPLFWRPNAAFKWARRHASCRSRTDLQYLRSLRTTPATGGGGDGGRGLAKGNLPQQNASRTPSRTDAPSALERVRQAAKGDKRLRFTALLHHIYSLETLRGAYFSLKKEAAAGVDGETWRHYGESLEDNLRDLSERLKRGAYRAKPVRRVYIPVAFP